MASKLTFTLGAYVAPIEAVEATDETPAVAARPGGRHIATHSLTTDGSARSGSLWLEGMAEHASEKEIRSAILALYGLPD
jgi:hypothetical protein